MQSSSLKWDRRYKWLSGSNILTLFLLAGLVLMIFNSGSKSWMMRQMMNIGFFQAEMDENGSALPETPPGLVFQDGTGKKIDIAELTGKVIFINFWATWCGPCVAEMPSINRLYEHYKDNDKVLFFMVDVDSNYPKAQKFMDKKHLPLPVYIPAGPIPSNMLGGSIPCTVVIDKSGKMAFRHEGAADYDNKKFKDAILKLVND
ncbi:MAG: TlpA family protein disulfide reductase [Chitinophagaceae bacterium]|nr:TlpA family protein disulfide reductase [Chitinophagaceae bacterium]